MERNETYMKSLLGIIIGVSTLLIVTMVGGPLYQFLNFKSIFLIIGVLIAITLIANKQTDIFKIFRKEQIDNCDIRNVLKLLKNTLKGTVLISFFISSTQLAYSYDGIQSLGDPLAFLLSTGLYSTLLIIFVINPIESKIK